MADSSVTARTVLLVEDDEALRRLASRALQRDGYEVIQASNGREALSVVEQRALDLVIADMIMPEMSGHDLAAVIVRRFPRIAVLLISGYPTDVLTRSGGANGSVPFLEKPFTPDDLLARVRDVIGAREAARSRGEA